MRKIDSYGLKLCKFQGELFQASLTETNCSSKIFIRRFMLSDLAKRMDSYGFLFEAYDLLDCFQELQSQFGPSEYGRIKFNPEEMYWMGYLYRYWSYLSEKGSKQVYKIIKPDELRKLYFPYHSLDPEVAIERIMEAKGIYEEDQIQRGVKILRRIRNKTAGN